MSWTIEQGSLNLFGLSRLRKNNRISLFAFDIRIKINDLDSNFQIIQQSHNLNLICFFVNLFHFCLAEELNRKLILNEGLIENRIILELSTCEKPHHENKVI